MTFDGLNNAHITKYKIIYCNKKNSNSCDKIPFRHFLSFTLNDNVCLTYCTSTIKYTKLILRKYAF